MHGERKRRLQEVAQAMYCLSAWPQLYIFSAADHVIPHSAVKQWIQVRTEPLFLDHRTSDSQASRHAIRPVSWEMCRLVSGRCWACYLQT